MDLTIARQLLALGALLFLAYAMDLYRRYKTALKGINNLPGTRVFLNTFHPVGALLRYMPGVSLITPSPSFRWDRKYKIFQYFGLDVYTEVRVWPQLNAGFNLADAAAIKEVTTSRAVFQKPVYQALNLYGANVITTENEEWKRHRKISQPAFSERNNSLVWQETARLTNEIFAEWEGKETIAVDHVVDITLPLALLVISAAGFGRRVPWGEEVGSLGYTKPPAGHTMTFIQSVSTLCTGLFVKLVFPEWIMGLKSRWQRIRTSYHELEGYMTEMIETRQRERAAPDAEKEDVLDKSNLFDGLLAASEDELASGQTALSHKELMGNIFIFLLAGHETTAHSLAFAMGLLACHPDEQQRLFDHIKSVLGNSQEPAYENIHALTRPLAVLYETLRLFPPVISIPKTVACDTTLLVRMSTVEGKGTKGLGSSEDQRQRIFIPKGSSVFIDTMGLHYNPRYWEEPHDFNPDRFLRGDWNRDAFLPFSGGARACLGRRFSEIEVVAFLTNLVLRYKIELNPAAFDVISGEPPRETRERLLKVRSGMTLAPARLPLVFRRRM